MTNDNHYPSQPFPSPSDLNRWKLCKERGHTDIFDSVTICSGYGWTREELEKLRALDLSTPSTDCPLATETEVWHTVGTTASKFK